ncbi:hypothetical protein CORC01_02080 [Colletotrichum orchidophilum]|uniref:Uncharacterized protein n=1 Tax=Colletotrichum orchidophilum TaxID=1209926 RepID=A0A1G4BMP8_9PEZI|nr:uncharacterized protein CORC01_02080 [Colletotrichum orchidophilum]OHF02684.1 hypothetical protein CORC01_02080 [Colletotrichum orchidophilum]
MSPKQPIPKRDLEQGLYIVEIPKQTPAKEEPTKKKPTKEEPNVDIIVVPGFGADPLNCWAWKKDGEYGFNWITSGSGLIVHGLLLSLREKRREYNEKGRPIIFIGHSMGGLVVAKALTEMDRLRDDFGELLPCVTSCVFFGTPFLGTGMASYFSCVIEEMKKKELEVCDAFWTMMRPESDSLRTLRHEVTQLAQRISPPIVLSYVFETLEVAKKDYFPQRDSGNNDSRPAGESDGSYLSFMRGLDEDTTTRLDNCFESSLKSSKGLFVTCASATKGSEKGLGLQCNHRDLVTFPDVKNEKYKSVLGELGSLVDRAETTCRKRLFASSQHSMSPHAADALRNMLDSGIKRDHEALVGAKKEESWVLQDEHYQNWKLLRSSKSFFWIKGRPGHLLKSQYRRGSHSAIDSQNDDTTATLSLSNLWSCFKDILADDSTGDIYVVINNIHLLEDDQYSDELIEEISKEVMATHKTQHQSGIRGARRWLITLTDGGDSRRFEKLIDRQTSYVADLSTSEFAEKVKNSLKDYVQRKVVDLHQTKRYAPDQRYMIEDLMVDHADNTHWIDIQCIRLGELELDSSTESITRTLGLTNASSLENLVRHCWLTVLERDPQLKPSLVELLRALVLAFRSPSVKELYILSGIKDEGKVIHLIDQCAPMIRLVPQDKGMTTVEFGNATLKHQLLLKSDKLLGLSGGSPNAESKKPETERYHGVLAWRCFSYLERALKPAMAGMDRSTFIKSLYPLDFWMNHAIQGKRELSDDLARHLHGFWKNPSPLRDAWLALCLPNAQSFEHSISITGMTALHTAAAFGFDKLVMSLITNGHQHEVDCGNLEGYTPLHIAAVFNHTETIKVLLRSSGKDAVNKSMKLLGAPLHLSAIQGHLASLRLLLEKGANPNALSEMYGPVINAAIKSGHSEAVQALLGHDNIDLDAANPNGSPPLALAAGMSPEDVFKHILLGGKAKWTAQHHRRALEEACRNNKPGNIQALLEHAGASFDDATLTSAVLTAAIENNWDCVLAISRPELGGSNVFYLAAVTLRDGSSASTVLQKTWSASHATIEKEVRNAALYQATDNQKAETVAWLLDTCKADANATDHRPGSLDPSYFTNILSTFGNALAAAAWDGTIDIVKNLVEHGAQIDSPNGCPLQLAAREGHAEVVSYLLGQKAKVNRIPGEEHDYQGSSFSEGTALQAACQYGKTNVVKILLEWKANPNLGRGLYTNPIIAATTRNRPEILKLLLAAPGVDVNVRGVNDLSTPLMNAAFLMSYADTELILNAGADVNQSGPDDETAVIRAARKGDAEILRLLISRGADILHEGKDERTALDIAANQGHLQCLKVLAESVSPLFRGLKRAIANGSTFARDLVARPGDDHDIVDMVAVNQLRDQVVNLTREVEDLHSIQLGWNDMMSKVQAAETNTAGYKERMDQMRRERGEESATIERERGEYKAARYGFTKLHEERDSLKQEVAACKLGLEVQKRDSDSKIQRLQKELEGVHALWTEAEAQRKNMAEEAAKTQRQLETVHEKAKKMEQDMSTEISSLRQKLDPSEQQVDGQATPSGGRDDESYTEGDDVLSQNAGSSFSVSSAHDTTGDMSTGKTAAKSWKDIRHNSSQFMADLVSKQRGSPKPDGQR